MSGQPAYRIQVLAGSGQSAVVGQPVAVTPMVLVTTTTDGLAAPDAPLIWTASGDSSISGTSVLRTTTASSGAATGLSAATWRLGATAQPYNLTVQVPGQSAVVVVSATATVAPAAFINAITSLSQSTGTSSAVATPPSVQVTDANGNPIAGYAVSWAVTGGGGSVDTTGATITNASGLATLASWTTGAGVGVNTVTATAAGLGGSPVTFTANATATLPTAIAINSGDGQTGIVAGAAGADFSVLVTGAGATPIVGYTVTWTVLTGGGSIPGASVTNGSGIATATPTSGATSPRDNAGTNTYSAFVAGVGSVTFTLAAVAGTKTKLALQTQPSTNGASGTTLPGQPVVLIQDANGNTVTSATDTITATVTSGPGSVTAGGTKAAVAGVATFTALAITDVIGQNNLLHFASGSLTAVDATNPTLIAPPVPDRILMVTQPTNGTATQTLASVVVRVTDASSVTIPGYTGAVTAAIGTNPAAGTLSGTLTVNCVNGVATFGNLAIDNVGTGYTLTFAATGLTGATSSSFNIAAVGATNEPAGFTPLFGASGVVLASGASGLTFSSISFNDASTYAPAVTTNGVTITPPGVPPTGNVNIAGMTYPLPFTSGSGHGQFYRTPNLAALAVKELYVRYYFQVSSNWYGESTGTVKLYQPTINATGVANRIVVSCHGANTTALKMKVAFQSCVAIQGSGTPLSTSYFSPAAGTGSITRGTWNLIEVYVKGNSAGTANGIFQMWVNGTQTHLMTANQYDAGAVTFLNTNNNSVYGGPTVANSIPDNQYIWWGSPYYASYHT